MKNKLARLLFLFSLSAPIFTSALPAKKTGEFYQITIYHYVSSEQQKVIEQYLEEAYLPALHRQNIKNVGVFTVIANDTSANKRLYLIVPLRSLEQINTLSATIARDKDYRENGKSYLEATYKNPPYSRMEKIFLKAFSHAPFLNLPKLSGPRSERVYELRSYESASEKIHENKVEMFNEGGEIALFKQLNFNGIFYASVIAGSHMPNLMYLTSFNNRADRDEHWKSFGASPEWKKLSALPKYQNNVSKNEQIFLKATDYSDY